MSEVKSMVAEDRSMMADQFETMRRVVQFALETSLREPPPLEENPTWFLHEGDDRNWTERPLEDGKSLVLSFVPFVLAHLATLSRPYMAEELWRRAGWPDLTHAIKALVREHIYRLPRAITTATKHDDITNAFSPVFKRIDAVRQVVDDIICSDVQYPDQQTHEAFVRLVLKAHTHNDKKM